METTQMGLIAAACVIVLTAGAVVLRSQPKKTTASAPLLDDLVGVHVKNPNGTIDYLIGDRWVTTKGGKRKSKKNKK
jgi:hypothetical protein